MTGCPDGRYMIRGAVRLRFFRSRIAPTKSVKCMQLNVMELVSDKRRLRLCLDYAFGEEIDKSWRRADSAEMKAICAGYAGRCRCRARKEVSIH